MNVQVSGALVPADRCAWKRREKGAGVKLAVAFFAISVFAQPAKIVLVGDSTVNDEGGWGPGFRAAMGDRYAILNLAKNGRSSKSFRSEGHWAKALAERPAFVLIQFGHNDVPGKGPERETDASSTYRANLAQFIDEAKAIGAKPILVTSIVRRGFTPDGKFRPDSLLPYVEAVHVVAREKSVAVMDLYTRTREQATALGPEGAKEIGRVLPDRKQDKTHLGPMGQASVGRMAAEEFERVR
ncbi:MAG: rhamnogalacturonan acetylesterase [Acidobacteria bacterium]|nr:rhamnogalacturonan acetylesterase [Acidobacteriota bacterium]